MTAQEIYEEMLECFSQETGLEMEEGCDLAVRLWAASAQLFGLYSQCEWVVRQCFPQTAQGEQLDYHAQLRGLSRKEAIRAQGTMRFTASYSGETERVIPAGTVAMTGNLVRFETTEEGVLAVGDDFVDIPARAVEAGSAGNVACATVTALSSVPAGIGSCTNPAAFTGGADAEGDGALRERILASFRRLPNGANAAYYEQEALSFDDVTAAAVLPRNRGIGTVDVVIATEDGVPGESLLNQVSAYFAQCREIAVDVQVLAPNRRNLDVSITVQTDSGTDREQTLQTVRERVRAWFTGERLGRDVLRAQLGKLIYDCEGVENYNILAPQADVSVAEDELPVLGILQVEAMA